MCISVSLAVLVADRVVSMVMFFFNQRVLGCDGFHWCNE